MTVDFTRHGTAMKTTITLAEDPTMEIVALESTGGGAVGGSEIDARQRGSRRKSIGGTKLLRLPTLMPSAAYSASGAAAANYQQDQYTG